MDWKELLSTVVEEAKIQFLDVRFICVQYQGKWFLKRFHVTVFHAEPSLPQQVRYPSHLFLRQKMSSSDFLQLISDLTTRTTLSAQEGAQLTEEEKLKKFSVNGWDIWYEYAGVNFTVHAHGNSGWGLVERALPFWSFGGNIYPDQPENQEPLVAPGVPSFPTPLDGQAWYLYRNSLQGPNNFLPAVEISLEDDRAFFQDIVIDEKAATLRCQCGGKLLSQTTLRLYTKAKTPQIEEKQAEQEVVFHLQGEPKDIWLALTYADTWLDKKDINFNYPLGIPKSFNVVGRSSRPGRELTANSTPAIEEIAQADPSGLATIAGPHLKLVDGYYNNVLQQSRRSFSWAIVGFVSVFNFFAVAVLLLIFRSPGNATTLAAIITALGGATSGLLTGYLLNLHKSASAQAAASQVHLDRIQRFFIANSASENLQEASKDSTREALIKKLGDL